MRERPARVAGLDGEAERVVERGGLGVEVAVGDPAGDPRRVGLDADRHAAGHRDGERLGAAHPAKARGQRDRALQRAAEALVADGGERLVGALQDPLAADVDPRAGGHLPVHRQPERLEAAELLPVGPVADEVGVGQQHARRPLVGLDDADGAAGLHEQRLVVLERAQRAGDRVEGGPVAGGLAGAAVDDEVLRALGDLGVEVVVEHPQRGLLRPAEAGELGAARGSDGVQLGAHASLPQTDSAARRARP